MYLNQTTEYALRTSACLARQAPARTRAEDLAAIAGVPRPYASKILRRLTMAGLLTSRKGRGGGFVLARRPEEIRFVDVMRAMDFEPAADHCLFGWESCDSQSPCPLHPLWSELKESIEDWARNSTLADLRRTVEDTLRSPVVAPAP
jgi:Rrf2 family protein